MPPNKARRRSIRDIFHVALPNDSGSNRLVNKHGESNINLQHQPGSKQWFYPNIFISVVKMDSKWITLIFLSCFLLSWFLFALLFYITSKANGDFMLDTELMPDRVPCIVGVDDFLSTFQFSMETQTTIGYGTRYVTEECSATVFLVVFQSVLGNLLLAFLTGVVLFKFQEPTKRAHTLLFSKVACVFEEDGQYFVEIQILNMQKSQVIGPSVVGICIVDKDNGRGKFRFDMDFKPFPQNSRLFFRPRVYRHLIDTDSPFWEFNRNDFKSRVYEIVLMINGVDEFTDTFIQARTSYLPSEVLWSRSFKTMSATRTGKTFKLRYRDFTATTTVTDMSDDSASVASRRVSDASSEVSSLSGGSDEDETTEI